MWYQGDMGTKIEPEEEGGQRCINRQDNIYFYALICMHSFAYNIFVVER